MTKRIKVLFVFCCMILSLMQLHCTTYAANNVALGKRTYSSTFFNENYSHEMVTDGDYYTSWSSGSEVLYGKTGSYDYVAVDLGGPHMIERVVAYSRYDFDQVGDRGGWLLQVSNDEKFSTYVEIGKKVEAGDFKSTADIEVSLEQPYRYVRVACNNYIVVGEIEVYGTQIVEGGEVSYNDIEEERLKGPGALMSNLGIIKGSQAGKFYPYNLITREEATKFIYEIAGLSVDENYVSYFSDVNEETQYAKEIMAGLNAGYISKAQNFYPSDYIKTVDFLKMLLCVMGYSVRLDVRGGYPSGVVAVANELKLLSGTDCGIFDVLNRKNAVYILYNALRSYRYDSISVSDDGVYYEKSKKTFLEERYGYVISEGQVTANAFGTLYQPQNNASGFIQIDYNKNYSDLTGKMNGSIGKNVVYMCPSDENEIIFFWEASEKNNIETILKSDIVSYKDKTLTVESDGKRQNYQYENDVVVFKNGVIYPNWSSADFMSSDGYIELLYNDSDNRADVVFVYEPEIIIVDTVRGDDKLVITGLNNKTVNIDMPESVDIYISGEKSSLENISRYDVVYLYLSDKREYAKICVSDERFTGSIDEYNDKGITIGNNTYKYTDYYLSDSKKAELNEKNTFLFDDKNRLVWILDPQIMKSDDIIGIILNMRYQGFSEAYFEVYNQYSEFCELKIADRVYLDGEKKSVDDIISVIANTPEYFKTKFMIYKTDKDGNIDYIDTENYIIEKEPDSRMVKSDIDIGTNCDYIKNVNGFFDRSYMKMPIKADSIAFHLPVTNGEIATSEDFRKYYKGTVVENVFEDSNPLNDRSAFYSIDEYGFPLLSVRYTEFFVYESGSVTTLNNANAPAMIINKVSKAAYEGEPVRKVSGYNLSDGKDIVIYIPESIKYIYDSHKIIQDTQWKDGRNMLNIGNVSEDELAPYKKSIDSIKCGDILRYELSGKQVTAIERVFEYSSHIDSYNSADGSYYSAGVNAGWPFAFMRMIYGDINTVTEDILVLDTVDSSKETVLFGEIPTLIVCDGNSLKKQSVKELRSYCDDDSQIAMFTQWSRNLCLIIFN